jgi:hypothetical protein
MEEASETLQKKIHLMEVVIDGKYRRANEPIRIELNGSCGCVFLKCRRRCGFFSFMEDNNKMFALDVDRLGVEMHFYSFYE